MKKCYHTNIGSNIDYVYQMFLNMHFVIMVDRCFTFQLECTCRRLFFANFSSTYNRFILITTLKYLIQVAFILMCHVIGVAFMIHHVTTNIICHLFQLIPNHCQNHLREMMANIASHTKSCVQCIHQRRIKTRHDLVLNKFFLLFT